MSRKTSPSTIAIGIAACSAELSAGREIQLFPAGEFRATDGRPKDAPHWYIDEALAGNIITQVSAQANRLVIDYEHQSLMAAENGQPAPAAGWFKALEWREGDGLYAIDVEWTTRATGMISAGEYRYISPVFSYDKKTGAIQGLFNAALTNNPALDGMDEVVLQAASQLFLNQKEKGLKMDYEDLLSNLRWLLNLPALATPEEVAAELQKAADVIKAGNPEAVAAGFSLPVLLAARNGEIAALKIAVPDPAKYVPTETMATVQNELAALRAEVNSREIDSLVTVALADGRLLPAQEQWARGLASKDLSALKDYIATAQPIAALSGTQTRGKQPSGNELDRNDPKAISEAATKYQAEQAALGKNVSIAQAVNHVTK